MSKVEPYRDLVLEWLRSKMEAQTIWSALQRNHGYEGSYSSVRRFVRKLVATIPDPIVRLPFRSGRLWINDRLPVESATGMRGIRSED